jgi:hypothetical protein
MTLNENPHKSTDSWIIGRIYFVVAVVKDNVLKMVAKATGLPVKIVGKLKLCCKNYE